MTRPQPDAVLAGRVVLEDTVLADGVVEVTGTRLGYVGPASGWRGSAAEPVGTIAPGFVDVHCHGGGGHSVTTGAGADIELVGQHHLRRGSTTLLASLVTAPAAEIGPAVAEIAAVSARGSAIVGSHLEGPYLGRGHCGAHDPDHLQQPDPAAVREWLAAGAGTVRMVTLAPELPGADAVAELVAGAGALVALGHTDADHATFARALAATPTGMVTHLFNGMATMHHRAPGPVGASLAALAAGTAHVELIADGVHLDDATVALVFGLARPEGPGGVVLVSDAMAAAGQPDGRYQLGPRSVDVRDGVAWTGRDDGDDEDLLAGSTAHLADLVRRCVCVVGLDPARVVRAASATPARLLGLEDRGRLATGLRADLVTLDETWQVTSVRRGGELVS